MTASLARTSAIAVGITLLLSGCSAVRRANLGIRPDAPEFLSTESPCQQFDKLAEYSQNLQEAYHSRATQRG